MTRNGPKAHTITFNLAPCCFLGASQLAKVAKTMTHTEYSAYVRACARFNCPAVLSGLLPNRDVFFARVFRRVQGSLPYLRFCFHDKSKHTNTHAHSHTVALSGFPASSDRTYANLQEVEKEEGGKEKKAPPHRDGLTFLSFTPHSLARSLTSAHQVGDSDDGERDAVVPQSHRRPRYSPASDLFRGIPLPRRYHGDMNPQVHSSDGAFSVSASAGCARTYVCRLCGRARTAASVCVLLFFYF